MVIRYKLLYPFSRMDVLRFSSMYVFHWCEQTVSLFFSNFGVDFGNDWETIRERGVTNCQDCSSSEDCLSAPQLTEWDAILAVSRFGHLKEEWSVESQIEQAKRHYFFLEDDWFLSSLWFLLIFCCSFLPFFLQDWITCPFQYQQKRALSEVDPGW